MIVTPGTVLRVGLLLLVAVVTQISGFAGIRVFGGVFDLLPLVVAAIALYGGSITGAGIGFLLGLLAGLAIKLLSPPNYQSTSEVHVPAAPAKLFFYINQCAYP